MFGGVVVYFLLVLMFVVLVVVVGVDEIVIVVFLMWFGFENLDVCVVCYELGIKEFYWIGGV